MNDSDAIAAALASQACAAEPIQYSAAIQPHGFLISCVLPEWSIRHVSANVGTLLDVEPESLIGQSLREYVTDEVLQPVADVANLAEPGATPLRAVTSNIGPEARLFDISVHVNDGLVHLELEPRTLSARDRAPSAIAQAMIARVADEERMDVMYQRAVEQLLALIDFDRVLVYRFMPDGAGEVIAEARVEEIPPLMGLRFPESDIPAQARALYVRNRIRVIPDTSYVPVPILPATGAGSGQLDLSMHLLRSVSPVHLEYTRNMGVAASMSISLISGGQLWGLIACHHRAPKTISSAVRAAAELFGLFLSMRVSSHDQQIVMVRDEFAREMRETLWRKLAFTRDLDQALTGELEHLALSMNCDGVAVLVEGVWSGHGHVPDGDCAPALQAWLNDGDARRNIVSTHLAHDWAASECQSEGVAGLLALRLGKRDDWLLFFRNELIEEVHWAGEPLKTAETVDGRLLIKPRERFEAWREVIRGRSLPWSDLDRRMADRLRQMLNEFRVRAMQASDSDIVDFEASLRHNTLREQRTRLEQLSQMFDGLVHLDEADVARLSERISLLEAELRTLAAAVPAIVDNTRD